MELYGGEIMCWKNVYFIHVKMETDLEVMARFGFRFLGFSGVLYTKRFIFCVVHILNGIKYYKPFCWRTENFGTPQQRTLTGISSLNLSKTQIAQVLS